MRAEHEKIHVNILFGEDKLEENEVQNGIKSQISTSTGSIAISLQRKKSFKEKIEEVYKLEYKFSQ